jgi:hypothetical protein
VTKSRKDGRPFDHEDHAQGAGFLPKRTNRRHGSWSDPHKGQRHGFICHLGREWVDTFANRQDAVTERQQFWPGERAYRLEAMQYMVANMEARYARLPNQPNLRGIWAFHQRLVLPPSRRGRSEITQEFTIVYPNPKLEVNAPGTGGAPITNLILGSGLTGRAPVIRRGTYPGHGIGQAASSLKNVPRYYLPI